MVLDEAEDASWVSRNVARGRRTREPVERRKADVLDMDEFRTLLEAAAELDREDHWPQTSLRARDARTLRNEAGMTWKTIARRVRVAESTPIYLYRPHETVGQSIGTPRREVLATLGLAGLRVGELCGLATRDVDLVKGRIYVRDAKTVAGVRVVDARPRLRETRGELNWLHMQTPTMRRLTKS